MSLKKRRFYFLFFLAVFVLSVPVILLYTNGYRLGDNFRLVKTGGIYVSASSSGAEIYVNNNLKKTTNLIQRDFFESNLTPGTYFVFVYKDGYSPWSKELKVNEQMVSEAHAFLVPHEPKTEEIPKTVAEGNVLSSPNPLYKNVSLLFSGKKVPEDAELTTNSASATSTVTENNITLIREGGIIFAKWLGNILRAPFYFCDEYKHSCEEKVAIFSSPTKIKTFDFYPGRNDVIIIARKNGIYAVEADKRRVQNFALIYGGGDPDFRVGSDDNLYVKDGDAIYKVTL